VGFVPTMGALHEGHLALVEEARRKCGAVAVSIFVNPLQFNDPKDLEKYPRRVEEDSAMLAEIRCDMVFVPTAEAVYRDHKTAKYDLGGLDQVLEGPSRPGHFQGVVNVVERLFHFVRPDLAFFGEKDRQQLAVISHCAKSLHWPEQIVACPTVRAADGLALSSRNMRLSPEERAEAPVIYQSLLAVKKEAAAGSSMEQARAAGLAVLKSQPSITLDYLEVVDERTLRPLIHKGDREHAIALIAAFLGPVRLIDNISLRG
jgi:pantoate--beta-alanine ligase